LRGLRRETAPRGDDNESINRTGITTPLLVDSRHLVPLSRSSAMAEFQIVGKANR